MGTIPEGFFWNLDPRGYALKIDPEKGGVVGLMTDWGGYGILAPEKPKHVTRAFRNLKA